ncbi:hypothetical protein [Pseudarthrobacter sp. S9]|uniref:hypothetical protein n=1 Tax=Pseudarthrobacter sp. S9 TaxID=3418421 RepID=UPI003D00F7AA
MNRLRYFLSEGVCGRRPVPRADLLVTYIPEDLKDEPFGGRHFKKGMPKEFEHDRVIMAV